MLLSTVAFGQMGTSMIDENSGWQDRLYFGGGMGLSGGQGYAHCDGYSMGIHQRRRVGTTLAGRTATTRLD